MKRDLTEQSRSQSRTNRIRAERLHIPKRLSVVSTLAFLAFVLLGMCGAQTAQAQTFFITPNNPGAITGTNNAQGFENQNPVFTVGIIGGATDQTYRVNVATTNGSATAGTDFYSLGVQLSFPGAGAGVTATQTVTVRIIDDGSDEPTENFSVGLSGATNGATIDGARTQQHLQFAGRR